MGKSRKKKPRAASLNDKPAEELAQLGEQFLEEGDFGEARKQFAASIEKEQNPEVMFSLARCLLELNKPEEAKQQLLRSCELDPDKNPDKWLSLAELEQGKESLRCFQKAMEILERELHQPIAMEQDVDDSEDKENFEKSKLRKLSNVYVCVSELYTTDLCDEPEAEEAAVSSIQKAVEIDSQNPEAFQAKAAYHLIKEDFDAAKQDIKKSLDLWVPLFEKAVEGDEQHFDQIPPFNVRLAGAKLLLELEMYDEAINVLDGLALEDEESVDVWYLLGWTNYLQGADHHPNAKFFLSKAKKVAADYECDDEQMVEHIDQILVELQDVETDNENDSEECWESDDE